MQINVYACFVNRRKDYTRPMKFVSSKQTAQNSDDSDSNNEVCTTYILHCMYMYKVCAITRSYSIKAACMVIAILL